MRHALAGMSALLSLVGVSRLVRRGSAVEPLLTEVSLEVAAGELVAVVGMRSQGKTTLLQIAAGLERPEAGVVFFAGRSLEELSDREHARLLREEIGLVGQSGPQADLRVGHYVSAPLLVSRRRGRARAVAARAAGALERVGIGSRAGQRWGELSRWDRALVEIAQGIVGGPRLLLVDDVCDGLGMRETAQVTRLLRSLAQDDGMGVLMAVSDGEGASAAHRVLRLSRGGLRQISVQRREPENVTAKVRRASGGNGGAG
jgi:putative ABC transport system ATP-binding protein